MEQALSREPCATAAVIATLYRESTVVKTLLDGAESAVRRALPLGAPKEAAAAQCVEILLGREVLVEYTVPAARPP